MPFQKGNQYAYKRGQSGNPSGRRAMSMDAVELAQALTPRAINALDQALDDPERAVNAAQILLDRGWGKPPQAVYAQVNGNLNLTGGIDAPPRETLAQWIERRRRELETLDGTALPAPNGDANAKDDADNSDK